MPFIPELIQSHFLIPWILLIVSFITLAKCADIFVDSAIGFAFKLNIPKLVIGLILVAIATSTPELTVSLLSALRGKPTIALGNAIGSNICNDGLALSLAGIIAAAPILVMPRVLKTTGLFLLIVEALCFIFVAFDYTLNRWEGAILLALYILYILFIYNQHKKGKYKVENEEIEKIDEKKVDKLYKIIALFLLGLAGIIISSEIIIQSATAIALSFNIPESIIALLLVAFGTSIPEIATSIVAARKNEGSIVIGNILGSDMMNICLVAGASALANNLSLSFKEIYFMFPVLFIIIITTLSLIRIKYRLTRFKGTLLLLLYIIYIVCSVLIFRPQLPSL